MCARYLQKNSAEAVARLFDAAIHVPFEDRYNVAPTDVMPVLRLVDGGMRMDGLRWGLIPFWAKDPRIGARMINARAETVATKGAFKESFNTRRCVVPADGFFEWETQGKKKLPSLITLADGAPMAFAGIWAKWRPKDGGPRVESYSVITCDPEPGRLAELHDRMPVILPLDRVEAWLDPEATPETLQTLLRPAPDAALELTPVSTRVNSVRNDDPGCIEPREVQPKLL